MSCVSSSKLHIFQEITRDLVNAGEACAVAHFGDFVYSVGPVLLPLLYNIK